MSEKKLKLKTLTQLMSRIHIVPETELTKQYNEKETNENKSIESQLGMVNTGGFGQFIGSPSLTGVDFTDNYGLVFFDSCHDPGYNRGMNGCAYTSQLQLVDLNKKLTKLIVETFNYRGTGNCPFNHRINFQEGKILKEAKDKILFGMKSHEVLKFHEYDKKTKQKRLVETVDLDDIRKNQTKIEKFDKAFKELDKDAIKDFLSETNYFTSVKKITEDYALVIQVDPYGDTGVRHAKTKLVVRDKGIIDLKYHSKQFSSGCVTQGCSIEDISMKSEDEKILLEYTIKETASVIHSMGSTKKTLGRTRHSIELDSAELGIPIGQDIRLNSLVEKKRNNMLSPGNINSTPIAAYGFHDTEKDRFSKNYAYRIDTIMSKENDSEAYILTTKIIDLENYTLDRRTIFAVEPQINVSLYKVEGLDSNNPSLKEIRSVTTDTMDRKKYYLIVDIEEKSKEFIIPKPEITYDGKSIDLSLKVKGDDMSQKTIHFEI
ncbi:MAG: hypothetical protein ABIC91_08590 [Nanoarchaeota archaeon]|nr:DIP1984 family protein [Nanoarchaeota archaeon]MBU1030307.1 DIP1984 family protein [Nanoarchaeota archaeon]MBU1849320.1 DIP1984 family protein [Nanoarchaeota archaeon]